MAPRQLMSGDAAALMAANAASDGIALIELAAPVTDLKPAALYRAADESGELVKIYGKGATGNGRVGQKTPRIAASCAARTLVSANTASSSP